MGVNLLWNAVYPSIAPSYRLGSGKICFLVLTFLLIWLLTFYFCSSTWELSLWVIRPRLVETLGCEADLRLEKRGKFPLNIPVNWISLIFLGLKSLGFSWKNSESYRSSLVTYFGWFLSSLISYKCSCLYQFIIFSPRCDMSSRLLYPMRSIRKPLQMESDRLVGIAIWLCPNNP